MPAKITYIEVLVEDEGGNKTIDIYASRNKINALLTDNPGMRHYTKKHEEYFDANDEEG